MALALADALHLEAEGDVVDHAPVREEAEVLEDHRDGVAPQLAELVAIGAHHVVPGDLDLPGRRLDEPDQRAHERRLARAGEPHDDEDLARPDLERYVLDGDDAACLLAQLGAREVGVRRADEPFRVRPEDLPDTLRADRGRGSSDRSRCFVAAGAVSAVSVMRAPLIYHPACGAV